MNRVRLNLLSIAALFLIALNICGCKESNHSLNYEVKHSGALRAIMSGNLDATVKLDTLSSMSNLYALGAFENLEGELQILNGKPYNSMVKDSLVVIDSSFDRKAALLVYAQIPVWTEITIPVSVKTKVALEEFIQVSAMNNGLDMGKPFPFLVEGEISSLDWHVIDWPKGDTSHTHEKHRNSGLNGTIKDREVEVIGFFSLHHKAVFTHHTTNMHMHFKTKDDLLAGHVDNLQLGNDTKLKLPKK